MRTSPRVSDEEMEKQRDYIARLREINSAKEAVPKAFVETYGCQQSSSDSEKLKGMLADMGYEMCIFAEGADLVLYNTCAVRENAELRVFGNLGALKHSKRRNPAMLIGVCGCMTQQEHIAKAIKSKYKHVDMVFGTHALYRFPQILWEAVEHNRVFDVKDEAGAVFEDVPVRRDRFLWQGSHYVRLQQLLYLLHCALCSGQGAEPRPRKDFRGVQTGGV